MDEPYSYTAIDGPGAQIRLLTLDFDVKQAYGYSNANPLSGSLRNFYLPISTLPRAQRLVRSARLPPFYALSYVWGDPARTHEIIIDGRKLGITENLYKALRDLQRGAIGDCQIWADAICINQHDLAERSDQIFLMREIYHTAPEVQIWLGSGTEDGIRCMKFIASLTGGSGYVGQPPPTTEMGSSEEKVMKVLLKSTASFVNAGYGFGQSMIQMIDIIQPGGRDDKAEMILDGDGDLSLHQETLKKLADWRPSAGRLRKVQEEDFFEIARLIDTSFIQNCAWFERMWVVQELGAAEAAQIIYAGNSEQWQNFLRVVYYLHYNCKVPVPNIRKLTGLEKIRLGWNDRKRQPLRELIQECRYRRATDPRDRIYSLLGLMGDRMNHLLQPDYNKSVSEVYAHATQYFITQSESLDPICGCQTIGRQEIPSWIPDYNLNQDLAASPLVAIDRRESIFAASGHDHRSKYTLDPSSMADWRILHTTGLCIDSLVMLSDYASEYEPFGSIERRWHSTIASASQLLQDLTKDVEASLGAISSVVGKYSNYWHSAGHPLSRTLDSKSTEMLSAVDGGRERFLPELWPAELEPNVHNTYIIDAYIQSLVCGRKMTTERISSGDIETILRTQLREEPVNELTDNDADLICKAFEAGMKRRNIAITSKGYIGAVPHQAQPGDLVCVLFGCSVPAVLRQRTDEDSYIFIGECYLHGFMDAEAIAMQVKGQLKEQDFILS